MPFAGWRQSHNALVDPRGLSPLLRVPGVAHEHAHLGGRRFGHPGLREQVCHAVVSPRLGAALGQVPQARQQWVLRPPICVTSVCTGAALDLWPASQRSTRLTFSRKARVKQVRAKKWSGFL